MFKNFLVFGLLFFNFQSVIAANIEMNGFASVYGRSSTTQKVRDESTDDHGLNFSNDSKIGMNIRSNFEEGWSAVGQFLASQKHPIPNENGANWGGEFDWFFLKYEDPSGFNLKIGRQLMPGSITAEYVDVGLTYPWRELPQQYYLAVSFKSFEGVALGYQMPFLGHTLTFQTYGGNGRPLLQPNADMVIETNDILGAVLRLDAGDWLFQAVYAQVHILIINPSYSPTPPSPVNIETSLDGTVQAVYLGGRYDAGKDMVYVEYLQSCRTGEPECDVRSYYGTYGRHFGKFLPHYTYAFADWIVAGFFDGHEISHTLGLNYQLRDSIVLKGEYLWQEDKHGAVFLTKEGRAESVAVGLDVVF